MKINVCLWELGVSTFSDDKIKHWKIFLVSFDNYLMMKRKEYQKTKQKQKQKEIQINHYSC